jgi:two-component system, LytTR family, response regulator LytT
MNILIIEDEIHTAKRLAQIIMEVEPHATVVAQLTSIEQAIKWFENHPPPDLIFQDIRLSDGLCFDIYQSVIVNSPIIFTTAYSEYALESFKLNSIDYIVKPYDKKDIRKVFEKFHGFREMFTPPETLLVKEILLGENKTMRKRFLIKTGDRYMSLNTSDIAWFVSEDGITFARTLKDKSHLIDLSISDVAGQLEPETFFQVNRKYILHIESIGRISSWFNSRLKLEINPPAGEDVIVSRERVKQFKEWLGG